MSHRPQDMVGGQELAEILITVLALMHNLILCTHTTKEMFSLNLFPKLNELL